MNAISPALLSLIWALLLCSASAAVFAWLARREARRLWSEQPVKLKDSVELGIRQEVDRLRCDSAEQARALRQELGDNVLGFQGVILESFTSLGDQQRDQMRTFGEEVRNGFESSGRRTSDIAQRVTEELKNISAAGSTASERLRTSVEVKLDLFGEKSSNAARDLRAEVAGAVKTVHESVTATLNARLKDLALATTSESQATRSDLNEGLARVGTRVNETLQQISVQQTERLDLLSRAVTSLTERQAHAQERLRQTIEGRLDAIRTENLTKLDEMRKTVDERLQSTLEARLGESFRLVSQQLESVYNGLGEMRSLAAGVGDLKRVLTNVKVRGTWGEVQLGNLLDQFLSPEQYMRNASIREESQERVEYAIRMPGRGDDSEVLLPIDAKFPQEDFARLIAASESGDAAGVEGAAAALEARITTYAKSIREKYIHAPVTTEFGILFLPTESLYAEVLRRPGLFEALQSQHHVVLAGPTTLAAMLNAFQMGFRSLAIEKRSSEVWQILGAVRTEFQKHGDVVTLLRKQLNTAITTIDKLDVRGRAMNRKLRGVELLPDTAATALLGLAQPQGEIDESALDPVDEPG